METSQESNENEFQKIVYEKLGLTIYAALNTPKEKIVENITANVQRGLPQAWPHAEQDTPIALCAGGPSLVDTLDEIRGIQEAGGKVVALANTAHFLVENGITPNCHVLLDAHPNPEWIVPDLNCTYLIASQCDPSTFDAVADRDHVHIWHAINNEKELEVVGQHYDKWVPIQGGNTISLRAFNLFSTLGFHVFEVFGMDGCFLDDRHHVYEQPDADDIKTTYMDCNGRRFKVTGWMIQQAMEFMRTVKIFGQDWRMRVHGNGLIAHMVRTGGS